MTFLIFLVRSPVALIGAVILLCVGWPMELVLGILFFPIKAMIHPATLVQEDYHRWPFNTLDSIVSLWGWARGGAPLESHEENGLLRFLERLW